MPSVMSACFGKGRWQWSAPVSAASTASVSPCRLGKQQHNQVVLVSGMAKGIDSFAHLGALRYLAACGYGTETIDELLDRLEWEERKKLKMN